MRTKVMGHSSDRLDIDPTIAPLRAHLDLAEMMDICRATIIDITGIAGIYQMGIADLKSAFNEAAAPNFVAESITMQLVRNAANPNLQDQQVTLKIHGPGGPLADRVELVPAGTDLNVAMRTLAHKIVSEGG